MSAHRSDLSARIITALPALALALFLIAEGGLLFTVGVFVLGVICLHELFAMYERAHPVRLAGFLGLLGLLLAAHYGGAQGAGGSKYVLLAAVATLPLLFGLALRQRRRSTAGLAITLLGLWWIGFGLAHGVMLRGLPHGEGVVIDVLVGTFAGDTGAYIGGRLFGRRPLAPTISPQKTVEGLLIGMLCAVAAVWLASRYESWMPASHAAVLGLGVAVLAPLGDLFESFVKRQAGVKDSGRVFGPHGGALDRLDAVLFAAVIGYYIWSAYT
jgi:phosphatidate cytidylyltransferase